jgi:hypothetical protein
VAEREVSKQLKEKKGAKVAEREVSKQLKEREVGGEKKAAGLLLGPVTLASVASGKGV